MSPIRLLVAVSRHVVKSWSMLDAGQQEYRDVVCGIGVQPHQVPSVLNNQWRGNVCARRLAEDRPGECCASRSKQLVRNDSNQFEGPLW